jgi:outer membrane protein assembly factor BamB
MRIMMKSVQTTLFAAAGLLLSSSLVSAQDWPQWRGTNRDAKATFQVPATWPKELKERWKVKVGDGVATPSLVGDKLFVFSREGKNEIVRCLDAATGKQLWEDKYEARAADGPASGFGGPRCSPTVAEGKVVTLGVRGTVSCLDASTGKVLWRKDEIKGWPMFYTSSSPLIVDGLVVAQLGSDRQGGIVGYDLATGAEKWKWMGEGPAYASLSLINVGKIKLVIAMTKAKMVGLNSTDGKLLWEAPFAVQGRGYNAASPVIDGQTLVYAGSGRGATAVKFSMDGDKLVAKELWKNTEKSVMYNTPIIKDGLLFGMTATNELFCLNMDTGKTAWSAPFSPAPAGATPPPAAGGAGRGGAGRGGAGGGRRGGGGRSGGGYGSIVDAGSVLVALTPSSQLLVYKPSADKFEEVARIKVASSQTYAYPVLSGDRLFVKDQDSVTLLGVQ